MFRGFEVALVFVMILAVGVCISPELDEADELLQTWHTLLGIDLNIIVTFSAIHPSHLRIRFSPARL